MGFELRQDPSSLEMVNKFTKRMESATKEVKSTIRKAQEDMTRYYNQRRSLAPIVKDGIPEERRYEMINRNYTLFQSNVLRRRGMYLVIVEERLWQRGKDTEAENNLLNDLGFNLCVAPQSPVMRLVAYFGVIESHQDRGPKELSGEVGVNR